MCIKKIDNLDVCTIYNTTINSTTINSTTTNIRENHKSMESDTIVINYPHSYSLMADPRHDIVSIGEPQIINGKKFECKKDTVLVMDSLDSLDHCLDIDSLNEHFEDYCDTASELDELIATTEVRETTDVNYGQHVISEIDIDMILTRPISRISSLININEFQKPDAIKKCISQTADTNHYFSTKHEELCKLFYERDETEITVKSSDYSNESFCHYCRNHQVLPDFEIYNFLDKYLMTNTNANIKYLILVFRLRPEIFFRYDVMMNKHLRKYILSYLHLDKSILDDLNLDDPSQIFLKNMNILNQYYSKVASSINSHVYENLFHQVNLKFIDYLRCDSCKNYMCPKHTYLANCYFGKCKSCEVKNWTICGWCKPSFNEDFACKYLHKKIDVV